MVKLVNDHSGGVPSLGTLLQALRGLYVEADPHDAGIRMNFESYWSRIDYEYELLTEPWAPAGAADDRRLLLHLSEFSSWVESILEGESTDHLR